MRPLPRLPLWLAPALFATALASAQPLPPSEVVMPGSQPPEIVSGLSLAQDPLVSLLHSGDGAPACANCHYDFSPGRATAIYDTWAGSMMGHASRDPLTWAALAIAEQDFAGVGDTCIRCHVSKGWIEGRSLPSNGSALLASDADGVTCHLCHRLADPGGAEPAILGEQAAGFEAASAACETGDAFAGVACSPATGAPCAGGVAACVPETFRGNAQIALFQDSASSTQISRLGPYADAAATQYHPFLQSTFQRDAALCGTCHDVSNPVTGDLAPAHGRQTGPLPSGAYLGAAGGAVAQKAAFQNPPYAYGTEQRTYSEWVASALGRTLVSAFDSLPPELRREGGAPALVAEATAFDGGDYGDGTPRAYTCQSCHMRPVTTQGCWIAGGARSDLPVHDLTGANTFAPRAILWLDDATLHGASRLRLGGGLAPSQRSATEAAIARAEASLRSAASLELVEPPAVLANTVRVVNLTGHKLFTGYPEGRRIWLNVKWWDAGGALLREDGEYGPIAVADDLDGDPETPDFANTLLDPENTNTHVWQVESGISPAWAAKLIGELGADPMAPLAYDRATGAVAATLADAAAAMESAGTPSFHLAWNDVVLHDDRIPPWRMDWSEASKRNALPVPETLYLPPGQAPEPGAEYLHWDEVALDPPPGAVRADVALRHQTTSWEYVQFLWKANRKDDAFLATVGDDLLDAWHATGQAEPVVMATVTIPEPGSTALGVLAAAVVGARRCRTKSGDS